MIDPQEWEEAALQYEEENVALRQQVEDLQRQHKTYHDLYSVAYSDRADLIQQVEDLTARANAADTERDAALDALAASQNDLGYALPTLDALRRQVEDLTATNSDLCGRLQRCGREVEDLTAARDRDVERMAWAHFETQETGARWSDLMAADQQTLIRRMAAALAAVSESETNPA